MKTPKRRYEASLTFSVPAKMAEQVETASQSQYIATSAYIRQALAKALRSDGYDLEAA
jgi:hypothetical protein